MSSSETALSAESRSNILGFTYVLFAALGFSAKAILVKLAYQYSVQLDAITLMLLRMAISLPFFLVVALWSAGDAVNAGENLLSKRDKLMILGLGLSGYYISSLLDFKGLQYISAGLERLIIFLYPTLVVVFSAIFLSKPISRRQIIALSISYLGMFLVFFDAVAPGMSENLLTGSFLVFLSAVTFACFLMGSGMMVKRIGSTRFTAYSMTVACVATCFHYTFTHGFKLLPFPSSVYYLAITMAVFSTVLPAFLMNAGIRRIGAGSAAMLSSVGPISTLALAYWLLGEVLSYSQLAGTVLVLTGVGIVSRLKR